MKKVIYLTFIIVFLAIAFQIYQVDVERRGLGREMANLADEIELIEEDNARLDGKIEYFSEPSTLWHQDCFQTGPK